ncbi:CHAT domain-containing protein [Phycicoccus sp. Soil748]|uniref:CHAT domain-containing protein n=1 Tax=Phycicoccus sp. Soil748 TaxID=1736397 RepID=UPI00070331EC|nr:CHAT domain-containing protein [Phycicoccus sp. Soil748]KRE56241.1 hypothetical protein ASG70_03580 [Phycicoccus sp. Soil748]
MARARVLITLAWTTLALRDRGRALALLDEARSLTDAPRLVALTHVQQAMLHVYCAEWREAVAALDRVGPAFDLLTEREQVAALLNGGLSHLSLLQLGPARTELERALALSLEHDLPEQEFKARHNLGCLEFYAGHLPQAIALMRAADEVDAPVARARAKQDLAAVLLEAGLLDQARDTLVDALGRARAEGLRLEQADIRLDLAAVAVLDRDTARARRELGAAIRVFRSRGAVGRQQSTALLRASVDVAEGRVPRDLDEVLAPYLPSGTGPSPVTPDERLAARLRVESLLLSGDVEAAGRAAQRLGGRARQGLAGDMHDRLLLAKVAAAQGDSRRARREVHTALRRLTQRQAPSQSLEVRSALAVHGRRLAEWDLDDALRSGSARRVFDSVERWRAVSHRLPPLAGTDDPAGAELVAELRLARRQLADAAERGGGGADVTDHDGGRSGELDRLQARVARLEWQVSQQDWSTAEHGDGSGVDGATTLTGARAALERRQEQALVLFDHGHDQYLLHTGPSGTTVQRLDGLAEVEALAERLTRDLRAGAYAAADPVMARAVGRAVDSSLAQLDRVLLGATELGDEPGGIVVCPSRSLASVPWAALPTLAGRPVTVATSMTRWAAPTSVPGTPAHTPLSVSALAGPDLRRARLEADSVASVWGASVSASGTADGPALRRALRRDTVVHVAAHGTHERQNPYFSSLLLADGPLFAHELPRPVTSSHVVLSACDVGQADLRPGDEPLGLTSALLALGVRSVVAAVAPVPDEVAAAAMVDYHRLLATGHGSAEALAATVAAHPGARAFNLYGADWAAPRTAAPS